MIATTRGALLRLVSGTDGYGDEADDNLNADPLHKDFPLSLIERDVDEFDRASGEWRTVRKLTGRVPSNVPIDDGYRIKDLRDGAIYAVDGFTRTPRGLSGRSSISMQLRRTDP